MPARRSKTPHVQWFVACELVQYEQGGNFSFMNVFEGFRVQLVPTNVEFTTSIQFRGGQGRHTLWLKIIDPNGVELNTNEVVFYLDSVLASHRMDTRIRMGVAAENLGRFRIVAVLDGRDVSEIPVLVDGPQVAAPPDVVVGP